MPFPAQDPQPYTEANISTLCPRQPGVYGIFSAERCIFISQADDLRMTLLLHLRGEWEISPVINRYHPTYWLAGIVAARRVLDELEAKLIAEYRPICNP